jgi:tetratricopeptide (TPR) repeat protein
LRQAAASSDRSTRLLLAASAGGVTAILADSLFNFQFAVPPTFILLFTLLAFPALAVADANDLPVPAQSSSKWTSLRVLASIGVLICAALLLRQTIGYTRAELKYAQGMREEALGGESLSRAEQTYRDALALNPLNGRIRFGLARVLYLENRFAEAYGEAETAGSTYSDSHLEVLKGRIQNGMGQSAAALAIYRHALALDPTLQSVQNEIERLRKTNPGGN